jgi:hypothetical protein
MTTSFLQKRFVAPALPTAPAEYDHRRDDQLNQNLRIYFNNLDNYLATISGALGGGVLGIPHVAASDTTDQYAGGNNTATLVLWNNADSINGFTLDPTGYATPQVSGVYKIDYSLQFANNANTAVDVWVWLEVNGGTQVPRSASKFTIPVRKSTGVFSYTVAYSSITFEVNAGDAVRLYWATELAYNPVGPVNGVYMEYLPAQTTPFAHPEAPSSIGSITFVSALTT